MSDKERKSLADFVYDLAKIVMSFIALKTDPHLSRYREILGTQAEFRAELVTSLALYYSLGWFQVRERESDRTEIEEQRERHRREIAEASEEIDEMERLLSRPGGDRGYIHGILSYARFNRINNTKKLKELKVVRGRPKKDIDIFFVNEMESLYQRVTGKKPGKGVTGPYARFLSAVHTDFRETAKQLDDETGNTVFPQLSVNILELAKRGKK